MIKMIQKLKNKKGFTLVELIVVIAIIAILTAVIVPLIARYSAQAQYTTLQDATQTISNSANNALSDGNQQAAVNIDSITGIKDGGILKITMSDGTVVVSDTNGAVDETAKDANASKNKGVQRAAERLCVSLATTLPDGCGFYAEVNQSAVAGVLYTNLSASVPDAKTKVVEVKDFDNAYAVGNDKGEPGDAIGASGKFLPATEEKKEGG